MFSATLKWKRIIIIIIWIKTSSWPIAQIHTLYSASETSRYNCAVHHIVRIYFHNVNHWFNQRFIIIRYYHCGNPFAALQCRSISARSPHSVASRLKPYKTHTGRSDAAHSRSHSAMMMAPYQPRSCVRMAAGSKNTSECPVHHLIAHRRLPAQSSHQIFENHAGQSHFILKKTSFLVIAI